LRHAVGNRNFEDVSPAVLDSHLAAAGVDAAVGSAHGF
jgi:hypothetical protein